MPERRFAVTWAVAAVQDLEEIVAFIAADSEANARRVLDRLRMRAASLEVSPARGRIVPELQRAGVTGWREALASPYRIVYRIADRRVHVVGVFDGRRDLEDLLLLRLVREGPATA